MYHENYYPPRIDEVIEYLSKVKEKYGNIPVTLCNSDLDLSTVTITGAVILDGNYYDFAHVMRLLKDSFENMDVKETIDNQCVLKEFAESLDDKYLLY